MNTIFRVTVPLEAKRARHAQLIEGINMVVLHGKVVRGYVVRVLQSSSTESWEIEIRLTEASKFHT